MAVGLNAIREICSRNSLAMTADLLQDLVEYKTTKSKTVMMAARSLMQLYRNVDANLLRKKDRGNLLFWVNNRQNSKLDFFSSFLFIFIKNHDNDVCLSFVHQLAFLISCTEKPQENPLIKPPGRQKELTYGRAPTSSQCFGLL